MRGHIKGIWKRVSLRVYVAALIVLAVGAIVGVVALSMFTKDWCRHTDSFFLSYFVCP